MGGLSDFAKLFGAGPKRKPPPQFARKKSKGGPSLDAYKRTYGPKDGQTVFDAAQIKAKRKGRK